MVVGRGTATHSRHRSPPPMRDAAQPHASAPGGDAMEIHGVVDYGFSPPHELDAPLQRLNRAIVARSVDDLTDCSAHEFALLEVVAGGCVDRVCSRSWLPRSRA